MMSGQPLDKSIRRARQAAMDALLHNASGPYHGLPRTAAWGYPEPYTRDMMISALGFFVSNKPKLTDKIRRVLEMLAQTQTPRGHIVSLAHDPTGRGASDTTPLFLLTTAIYRKLIGDETFLTEAVDKALTWMDYQSQEDEVIVGQLPTSDWRDEQWVLGFGLYVNTIVYGYLRLLGEHEKADTLRMHMNRLTVTSNPRHSHVHEGLRLLDKPYYALWSYKILASERFDLLGNSLAILTGLAAPTRAEEIIAWVEHERAALAEAGQLACGLPPNLFPYIQPGEPDWRRRYEQYNRPGDYHNGGVWPFICGFYVAACVAAGRHRLAYKNLQTLAELNRLTSRDDVEYGFQEWIHAIDGSPRGQTWQTWSAAMFVYACACVEQGCTPFFDEARQASWSRQEKTK